MQNNCRKVPNSSMVKTKFNTPCGYKFLGGRCNIRKERSPDSKCLKCKDYLEYLSNEMKCNFDTDNPSCRLIRNLALTITCHNCLGISQVFEDDTSSAVV